MKTLFQFAFKCENGATKLFMVEIENDHQAEALKGLCLNRMLGEKCTPLAVFQNCDKMTLIDETIDEVSFIDFIADVVGFDKLPNDVQKYIEYAASIGSGFVPEAETQEDLGDDDTDEEESENLEEKSEKLTSALVSLGFNNSQVKKWVKSQNSALGSQNIETLVKRGVQALVNAK
jgi:hypothetical protein